LRDLILAQRFARHASPITTIFYTHPSDEELYAGIRDLPCWNCALRWTTMNSGDKEIKWRAKGKKVEPWATCVGQHSLPGTPDVGPAPIRGMAGVLRKAHPHVEFSVWENGKMIFDENDRPVRGLEAQGS